MSKLRRSSTEKMLFGVCGGLAEHFNMDPTIMRLIFVLLTIFGVGTPVLIYIIMAIVMPAD
ncbi:MAG: PspC domain-containing protein [Balneolia bacterium]|nr:PspC domain-containing protein [Balneolia bacterium]